MECPECGSEQGWAEVGEEAIEFHCQRCHKNWKME